MGGSDPLCASRPRGDVDARDPAVSAALALWRARLRCAERGEGSPGGSDYRPPAGCEVPTLARWDRGEWALVSTPAAFESRALSALAEGREMHALVNPAAVPELEMPRPGGRGHSISGGEAGARERRDRRRPGGRRRVPARARRRVRGRPQVHIGYEH